MFVNFIFLNFVFVKIWLGSTEQGGIFKNLYLFKKKPHFYAI